MDPQEENKDLEVSAYSDDTSLYGMKLNAVPAPKKDIGIDINNQFLDNIVAAGTSSHIDIAKLQSFTQISNNRETVMELLDTMSEDSTIAAVLEIYAEDATETNDNGDIMWCASDDPNIAKYITYLLDTMNVNKNLYKWTYSLCKYGDVYLRLYRKSEYHDDLFDDEKEKKTLNEDVVVKYYGKNDNYSHYVEMVPNPAEMFELTRLGKSYAYIKASIASRQKTSDMMNAGTYRYSFRKNDVEVYDATNFVHAALEDNTSRIPEEVEIFLNDKDLETDSNGLKYTVRRGQSLLYNVFKIWREMCLLENSLLLNRLTKSSIIRIIGVEVGDMPKEKVGPHLVGIKQLIEQKSAIDVGNSLAEYTNPGPMENNIYVPTHNGVGNITTSQVGGDVDVKGIADIDYYKNKLYSSLRVPKQFLGDTDDAAGFNGGTSLSLISSRYAKAIKRIQNTMIQAITDAVNLMLLDKGLDSYINKFTLKMQTPTTQEERDRVDSAGNKINMIQDIMNLLDGTDISDSIVKLKILKSLLSATISDSEVLGIIQEEIDKLEENPEGAIGDDNQDIDNDLDINFNGPSGGMSDSDFGFDTGDMDFDNNTETENPESNDEMILPMPNELGAGDFTDLNNEEI